MINWFKKEKHSEYRDRLLKAFPQTLKKEVETVLNILPFNINDVKLCDGQIHKVDNLIHSNSSEVQLNNELLSIPSRLYFNEPDTELENKLTDIQKTILHCIFLRHHNGYLRQNRLEKLVESNEYWVLPFTFQLLGEYVFEILEVLDKHINEKRIDNYLRFKKENPKYWQQTESRMVSYWNEYYRRKFPELKDYLGRKIADRIKKVNN
jgi:hypothetical protein